MRNKKPKSQTRDFYVAHNPYPVNRGNNYNKNQHYLSTPNPHITCGKTPSKTHSFRYAKTANEIGDVEMGTQIFRTQTIRKDKVSHEIGESIRLAGHCNHIQKPQEPTYFLGNRHDVELMMSEVIRDSKIVKRIRKNRNGVEKPQSIKANEAVMLSAIASYPEELSKIEPELFKIWCDKTVEFAKQEYGDRLKIAMLHTDEQFPHLHFFIVPEGLDVATVSEHYKFRQDNPQLTKKESKYAETEIIRKQLDRYQDQVGMYTGLARFGPRSRSLARGEWKREKSQRITDAKRFAAAADAEESVKQQKKQFDHDLTTAKQRFGNLKTKIINDASEEANAKATTILIDAKKEAKKTAGKAAKAGASVANWIQGFVYHNAIDEVEEKRKNDLFNEQQKNKALLIDKDAENKAIRRKNAELSEKNIRFVVWAKSHGFNPDEIMKPTTAQAPTATPTQTPKPQGFDNKNPNYDNGGGPK